MNENGNRKKKKKQKTKLVRYYANVTVIVPEKGITKSETQ